MKEPTFFDFVVRVGGLAAVFAISILLTTVFFPGYESQVIVVIALFVVCVTSIRAWVQHVKVTRAKRKSRKSHHDRRQ